MSISDHAFACFPGLHFFTSKNIFAYETASDVTVTVLMIVVGGGFAFMLSFSEYLLLTNTSSLTLSISGIFKVHLVHVLVELEPMSEVGNLRPA